MTSMARTLLIALLLGGVAWRGGLAQPASQDNSPLFEPTAQDRFAAPSDESELQPPEFHVEVIAFAYGPFDPTEEDFRRGLRSKQPDLRSDERRLPAFGVSEETMTRLFPPDDEFDPSEEPTTGEILADQSRNRPSGPQIAEPAAPEQPDPSGLGRGERAQIGAIPGDELTEFPLGVDGQQQPAFRLRFLTAEELTLTEEYGILERLTAYTPLLHAGWVQPGLPENQARPVDLALLGADNPKGTIRLHLSRFLHVTLNLRYFPESPTPAPLEPPTDFRFTFPPAPVLEEIDLAPRYELVAQRRTRSGELHYFDHPAFGVLVMVSPRPEDPEEADDILSPAA